MFFFSKKRKQKKQENAIQDNACDVKEFAGHIDVILMGVDDEEARKRFLEVQRKVKYFNPSTDKRVLKLDKEIEGLLKDAKAEVELSLVKGKDKDDKVMTKLVQLEMRVLERKNLSE